MKDTERAVRKALGRVRAPGESEASERAWRLIRAANAEGPRTQSSRRSRRLGLQAALAFGLVALLVSPAGATVRHWVADAVNPGVEQAKPALTSLPTRGSLLVQSAEGPWIVHADGSKRLLGTYTGATWSPHGLYVAATSRHELATVDPAGTVRWTLERQGSVRLPNWNGPDGFRLAYLNGSSLRVVDGDGTGDRLLEPRVAPVTPAWMPGPRYVLAFVKPDGAVEAARADSGRVVFDSRPGPLPLSLQWSNNGRGLLVAEAGALELRGRSGAIRWHWSPPAGTRIVAARLAPSGERVALILSRGRGSSLLLVGPGAAPRAVFSGPGRFSGLEWSPDGSWLLLAWSSADQWLFLNPSQPGRVEAISNVSSQFAPGKLGAGQGAFPQIRGWCCSR